MRKLRRLICILAIAICPSVNTSAQEIAGSIHANFRLPNNDISSPNFGEISESVARAPNQSKRVLIKALSREMSV